MGWWIKIRWEDEYFNKVYGHLRLSASLCFIFVWNLFLFHLSEKVESLEGNESV